MDDLTPSPYDRTGVVSAQMADGYVPPSTSVTVDDLTGPDLRDLFRDIDDAYRAASAALAANDMQAWVEHAGRGAALFEKAARLNGWREETPDGR